MKELITKLLRENLLTEKLANVDSDVDMLYDLYFRKEINSLRRTNFMDKAMFATMRTDTSILKSPECVKSNAINPCEILINRGGMTYNPLKKRISLALNKDLIFQIKWLCHGEVSIFVDSLYDESEKISFEHEFTEQKIKGSIHHELAHWIDDSLHNSHLEKMVNKGTSTIYDDSRINSKLEIQGQIHNIKQLYNKYNKTWDELTFKDVLERLPSINTVHNQLTGNDKTQWVRDIKTRMNREGLLGKNMR